jgi:hypothetical protein
VDTLSITLPTNFPSGDRRPVRGALGTLDPLYDVDRDGLPLVVSVDTAVECARSALARRNDASVHDHTAMVQAAADLHAALQMVVAALDAERPA